MRDTKIDISHRKRADQVLKKICREDGMFWLRAWYIYLGVRLFGRSSAEPSIKKPIEHICVPIGKMDHST